MYSLRQACRIARLSRAAVRALVEAGVVRPAGGPAAFTFADLAAMRAWRDVPAARLRRSLAHLRLQGSGGRRLFARDARLWVHEPDGVAWDAETGQLGLPLDPAEGCASQVLVLVPVMAPADGGSATRSAGALDAIRPDGDGSDADGPDAEGLDLHGLDADGTDPDDAFAQALLPEPLRLYNRGVRLQHDGDAAAALVAYEAALALDDTLADAHHNAAVACLALHDLQRAVRHMHALRRLEPDGG